MESYRSVAVPRFSDSEPARLLSPSAMGCGYLNVMRVEEGFLMTSPHFLTKIVFYRKGVVVPTPTYADITEENTP